MKTFEPVNSTFDFTVDIPVGVHNIFINSTSFSWLNKTVYNVSAGIHWIIAGQSNAQTSGPSFDFPDFKIMTGFCFVVSASAVTKRSPSDTSSR